MTPPPIGREIEVLDREGRVVVRGRVIRHGASTFGVEGGWTLPRTQRWRYVW